MKVRRALISVSDKTGLEELARGLVELGVQIISSGGTATAIAEMGLPVTPVDEVTGQPEILGGRVKTLHPKIHGGILAREGVAQDVQDMADSQIEPIDLVCVNLYPFERYVNRRGVTEQELIEQIDIGGPAMVRAAAKNHDRVAIVTSPHQYRLLLDELEAGGGEVSGDTRRRFAAAAFQLTARYDSAIANWMADHDGAFPDNVIMGFERALDVSYGENPHQRAAYYVERGARIHLLSRVEKLHGKDLSFNNLLDLDSARNLLAEFSVPACVVMKHNNPCGVAVASDVLTAYTRARDCDPVSAYGGVIVVNRPVTAELGELLAGTFVEVLLAPGFEDAALEALTRKPNTRLLRNDERRRRNITERDFRRVLGGILIQDRDAETEDRDHMTVATSRQPTDREWGDLLFAWRVCKHVKSNAIILARDLATVGIGAGQMSRVDSVRLSIEKAQSPVEGSVLASDAFFPFADGPEAAITAGVTAVIQPGGSIRDDEVVAAADRPASPWS
ncbi:MAG: bifunctional phosphoribosylaminoimidazolecarboxamide formyltransferase/IMP cyclohydrolase [Thermoleophilia bacterium]